MVQLPVLDYSVNIYKFMITVVNLSFFIFIRGLIFHVITMVKSKYSGISVYYSFIEGLVIKSITKQNIKKIN